MDKIIVNKDFIKDHMEANGIKSMNELARNIGISEATLCRIMNGSRNPGQKVIGKMLAYYQTKFEKVFTYDSSLTNVNRTA